MEINGHTRLCGLIGNPVEHTLSPVIHNTVAEEMHDNLVYVPFHVEQGNLQKAIAGAYSLNVLGLNVTVPYKQAVIPYLDCVEGLAERIGAVNTLVRTENGFRGYNTDMMGLYRAMEEEGIAFEAEDMILLGAGGAARAAAFLCAEKGAKRVYLLNRSYEKAAVLAEEVNRTYERDCILPMSLSEYEKLPEEKMTAIQGTSAGLYPNTEDAVILDPAFYQHISKAYDLIYKPEETRFMKLVKEAGGEAYCGIRMLLYQGIIAYELFLDTKVPENVIRKVSALLQEKVKG